MEKIFSLEHQYQLYLKRVGITEDQMHPTQRVETKRAFMGAVGIMLDIFTNEITKYSEVQHIKILESFWDECKTYWKDESNSLK